MRHAGNHNIQTRSHGRLALRLLASGRTPHGLTGRPSNNRHTPENFARRFWAKVDRRGPDACWPWRGNQLKATGRGQVHLRWEGAKNIRRNAPVVAWELTHGPIPRGPGHHGTCVRHRCDNRICVNPAHLFLGTHADNIADAVAKGRMHRKLTPPRIAEILAARPLSPKAKRDFAARFGVTPQAIYQVARHAD